MSRHQSLVATLSRVSGGFKWLLFMSRHQSLVATLYLIKEKPVIASRRFSCRDITMLSRHYSLSFWLILSCLTCDPCRDLHQTSFNFPDVTTSSLDCANPKLQHSLTSCFHFCPAIFCTFTPPIGAFFYCFFFFLSHSLLITNW